MSERRARLCGACGRRTFLRAGGALATVAVAGCLGGDADTPAAITLSADATCDNCGMVISQHPGPNGQLFYAENEPVDHDPPFRYCSLKQGLFPNLLEAQQLGWTATAIYATDYSSVEYTLETEDETTYISSYTDADTFAPARDLTYVVESDVEGAMGPDFIPFSADDDATAFADEHDGDVASFDDIDEALVGK